MHYSHNYSLHMRRKKLQWRSQAPAHLRGGGIGVVGVAMATQLFSYNMAMPYDHALID